MSDAARFTIEGTPSEDPVTGDRVYVATNAQTLDVTLEQNPSVVISARFELLDPTDGEAPLASKGAPLVTWIENGDASITLGPVPYGINDTVTVLMPASGIESYIIRCTVSTAGDGTPASQVQVFDRLVTIFSTTTTPAIRKTVPNETTEARARGWSDSINDVVDATANAAGAGIPGGADTNVQFNDGGAFGGDPNYAWDKTDSKLTVVGSVNFGTTPLNVVSASGVITLTLDDRQILETKLTENVTSIVLNAPGGAGTYTWIITQANAASYTLPALAAWPIDARFVFDIVPIMPATPYLSLVLTIVYDGTDYRITTAGPFDTDVIIPNEGTYQGWWRGDKGVTIATGASDWKDKSIEYNLRVAGSVRDWDQSVGADQPASVVVAAANNKLGLDFDGTSDSMESVWTGGEVIASDTTTLMAVVDLDSLSGTRVIYDNQWSSGRWLLVVQDGDWKIHAPPEHPSYTVIGTASTGLQLIFLHLDGSSSKVISNGVQIGSNFTVPNHGYDSGQSIGAVYSGTGFLDARILEMAIWSPTLTTPQEVPIVAYANLRYDLGL